MRKPFSAVFLLMTHNVSSADDQYVCARISIDQHYAWECDDVDSGHFIHLTAVAIFAASLPHICRIFAKILDLQMQGNLR